MSLISDPDYMIHQLRLTYLRTVEDPYASRLLSFNQRHLENPYVLEAGLADPERWPQLLMPSTPKPAQVALSDSPLLARAVQNSNKDDAPRWNGAGGGTGGASLKYTTTIMGPTRTGMVGMRTNGRRSSNSSSTGVEKRARGDSNPVVNVQEASGPSNNAPAQELHKAAGTQEIDQRPLIAPQFARGAEMEQRRKARIQARNALAELRAANSQALGKPAENTTIDVEQEVSSESDSDSDFGDVAVGPDEEIDPEFEGQIVNSAGSDDGSLPSTASGVSTSSGYPVQTRPVRKLSQAAEQRRLGTHTEEPSSDEGKASTAIETDRPSLIPTKARSDGQVNPPHAVEPIRPGHRTRPPSFDSTPRASISGKVERPGHQSQQSIALDIYFARRPIPKKPAKSPTSALTKMLVAQEAVTDNPFTELYGAIAGRGDMPSTTLNIFFPESKKPFSAVKITVRKDATVEEVIGFGLWTYWEQKLEPPLDEGLTENDPRRSTVLSAVGWILRIGEEDGEVDEDFPAPDRAGRISKFSFPAFAICKATNAQIQQNRAAEAKIVRRPSRLMITKKKAPEPAAAQAPSTITGVPPPTGGLSVIPSMGTIPQNFGVSSSVGGGAHSGPPVFLRICVPEDADAVLRYTTINVTSDWYMADVLEHICRRRKIKDHQDYTLVSEGKKIVIPMDRTVASLQGETELLLVKKSSLGEDFKGPGRATDPNASIFAKRMSELPGPSTGPPMDFTDAYQSWVVYRKLPVMVGRLERTLAIDGDHIHIMPTAKGFLDNVKTTSYRMSSIQSIRRSKKSHSSFKITVAQDGPSKTYEFEAENEATAEIIVQRIKALIKPFQPKRASTLRRR
ncbi:related to stress-activated map kinase interacting protein 1 [Serendipita indica DSM 11827]|uniref:Related to stress-activated map kinase interacting protein 1 n=1 Tax=Serendipita indica (strain DSM 11827) TaxID=1109443 RepID=G4U2M4_SERID|nr:related to stress-activated map kinase interacting protein 1 [Serendipita indica DSM 11827]